MFPSAPAPGKASGPVLRDIHLPPEPSWWPPAPGWWMLAALVLMTLLGVVIASVMRRRRRMRIAAIVAEVDTFVAMHGNHAVQLAGQLHQLLRRAARHIDPRATHLRGDAWQACLATVPVPADVLHQLHSLDDAMYRPAAAFDARLAAAATRQWLLTALERGHVRTRPVSRKPQAESSRA
ncbi:DUF4381 domain-containing protein [Dyella terrae]|uniref:DUF4381 domain-containing protein n=3 Tax=Rhodanobacteraceae TaxID=1775411 RepID=A0A4R0YUB4_9GAMM|nr:DUF4381 domain-containing protein [Dyella terrae]TCI08707.1 DUF4381 domain-containing protein [Dyella soli]